MYTPPTIHSNNLTRNIRRISNKELHGFGNIIRLPRTLKRGCSNNFFNSRVLLSKVGKSDLNDWMTSYQTLVNISNGVTTKLDPNEHILLIMFEYDKNKGLREQIFAPCYHSYYYRSEQSPYIALGVNELEYSDFTNPPNFTFPLTWEYLDRNTGSEYLRIRYRQDN